MKKLVLLALLLFTFNGFANKEVIKKPLVEHQSKIKVQKEKSYILYKFVYKTSCGETAVSYSYEPVKASDLKAWVDAMEEYYCDPL